MASCEARQPINDWYGRSLTYPALYSTRNSGILDRHFEANIAARLLDASARLDHQAANSPETMKLFSEASRMASGGKPNVPFQCWWCRSL